MEIHRVVRWVPHFLDIRLTDGGEFTELGKKPAGVAVVS
jgi:hypothetical protein